ncbi:uncharacterized protein BO87DRAFT_388711 [Aspergillus neoniger CBS 115656]|uniref:Uncharacterized protein n=1 Tax=Aspergillus neoniger (strain CBS 115656) TaxID=1448310 RepID=A0A318YBY7_ASPNB|nr:hypothetical protein BO87DRAFT_388711 [Aspergillus neoniger CBS 115656]PYH31881.1 hypothetical protein BO87DRAFT_388711 [Aspergillus neoniger CBS 115656]
MSKHSYYLPGPNNRAQEHRIQNRRSCGTFIAKGLPQGGTWPCLQDVSQCSRLSNYGGHDVLQNHLLGHLMRQSPERQTCLIRWTCMRFIDSRSIYGHVLQEYEGNAAIHKLAASISEKGRVKDAENNLNCVQDVGQMDMEIMQVLPACRAKQHKLMHGPSIKMCGRWSFRKPDPNRAISGSYSRLPQGYWDL